MVALRVRVDRVLRYACTLFAAFAFVYFAPEVFATHTWVHAATLAGLAAVVFCLSRLLVPLLDLTGLRRRTGDPGSFILDAAVYAFAFVVLGGYAAALLHVVSTFSLSARRHGPSPLHERILRAAPGVPFWFLFNNVRELLAHRYEAYSFAGAGIFVALIMAAHVAYVFLWFDVFFTLRTGQRITNVWKAHAKDWVTWLLVLAQTLWAYSAAQLYFNREPLLAVVSFVPLIGIAFLLRREHRASLETYRLRNARAAMEAVLRKRDPRPYLSELLQSARSVYFNEDLAIYTREAGTGRFQPVVQTGDMRAARDVGVSIEDHLQRCERDPACTVLVGNAGNLVVYPVHVPEGYFGGLVVVRRTVMDEAIDREELRQLADDIEPVIASLHEITVTQDAASIDGLTGLLNRAGLERRVGKAFGEAFLPRVCLMVDVDNFKAVNDTQGHVRGDAVLRTIASVVAESCRAGDVVGRYGGEEFLLVLSNVAIETGIVIAERLRAAVWERANITVSVGVAAQSENERPDSLIARADEALYKAKREGRNRCVVA